MPEPDHHTSWISGGARFQVSVDCAPGQSEQDCTADFDEAVAALQTLFPPDP